MERGVKLSRSNYYELEGGEALLDVVHDSRGQWEGREEVWEVSCPATPWNSGLHVTLLSSPSSVVSYHFSCLFDVIHFQ